MQARGTEYLLWPELLTISMINQIGIDYHANYPKNSFVTLLTRHNNHYLADKLLLYRGSYWREFSEKNDWLFLLDIYKAIKDPFSSSIALAIESLFKKAFKLSEIAKYTVHEGMLQKFTTLKIASDLLEKVNHHYDNPNHQVENRRRAFRRS